MENRIIKALARAVMSVPPRKIIKAFKRAAAHVPAYKKILVEKGVRLERIKTLEDFGRTVPVLYKSDLFKEYSPKDLCIQGSIDSLASAIVTSGTTGLFAFKMITKQEMASEKAMIDRAFEIFFNAKKVKTCIVNVNPMGVSFVSSYPVIPTSVRSDIAWHVIKSFSANFEQVIIAGDPNFIKKLIEEGRQIEFGGAVEKLKFVMGGDWSSLTYFEYLKEALGAKNNDNLFSTFGITEIGLNIGMADKSMQAIRMEIQNNKELQKAIFGIELKTAPSLFFYDPRRTYIEKMNKDLPFSELTFTTLSNSSMPFIRYATGDCGTLLSADDLNKALERIGRKNLSVKLPLPILAISGRISNQVASNGITITAEDVKQMLYGNSEIARNITGDFRLSQYESSFKIEVQLLEGAEDSNVQSLVEKALEIFTPLVLVKTYEYHKFPYNMALDYESKWAYTNINKK